MKGLQKAFGTGLVLLTLASCGFKNKEYVTGIVTQEAGTLMQVLESEDSTKFYNPSYSLQIQTPKGLYKVLMAEKLDSKSFDSLKELAQTTKQGSVVRIEKKYFDKCFNEGTVGYLSPKKVLVDKE